MAEHAHLRLVTNAVVDHGEVELGTALLRRFLGIEKKEAIELAFFCEGRLSVAYPTNELHHVRLLRQAQREPGFNGAYQLVNGPIPKQLLYRYPPNKIVRCWNGRTKDGDIGLRRAVYIDIDPIRTSGISATDAEKRAGIEVRDRVEEFLNRELGQPAALGRGDSGNGAFILIALEQPCLEVLIASPRIQRFLNLLGKAFSTPYVTIDASVGNAARLMPCPGTWKRKGIDCAERPHRRVYFSCHPTVRPVRLEALIG